jgi:hypothetical protein
MNETMTSNTQELTAFELSDVSGGGPMIGIIAGVVDTLYEIGSAVYGAVQAIGPKDPWA